MANRRLARPTRKAQKRKLRLAKKDSHSGGSSKDAAQTQRAVQGRTRRGKQPAQSTLEQLRKQRSALLKRHARERVALRTHVREIDDRRARLRRGANVKVERRELGKYVRALKAEQRSKHAAELASIEAALAAETRRRGCAHGNGATHVKAKADDEWQDVGSADDDEDDVDADVVDIDTLQDMFAHLTA